MPSNKLKLVFLLLFIALGQQVLAQEQNKLPEFEWFGSIGTEFRYFHDKPLYPNQKETFFSSVFKPQAFLDFKNKKDQLVFKGFTRIDQYDRNRTHWDIRDLYWRHLFNKIELNVGLKTISWGKTESNNLVDIINQYDLLEGRNLEHKLGQPLVQFVYAPTWGAFELYLMTYHREIEFPDEYGRLRPGFKINYKNTQYEIEKAKYIPDVAFRFSKYIDNIDFAISNFYGTARLPLFLKNEINEMIPYYEQINQTGIEAQWLLGAYALKVEAINVYSKRQNIQAITVGNEYNFYFPSGLELKIMAEYTYDQRGEEQINGLDNDVFLGLHFNKNDINNTTFMIAGIYDLKHNTTLFRSSGERRLGNNWKLELSYNGFFNTDKKDFYHQIRNDSFFEIGLFHYF